MELFGELKLPAAESKEVENLDLRLKEQTAYWALLGDIEAAQKDDGQPVHRLLGHPDPVQGDMEAQSQLVTNGMGADSDGWDRDRERRLLKEKGVWRMLLQVDSDERTAHVLIEGLAENTVGPIPSVVGGSKRIRLDMPDGFEFKIGEIANSTSWHVNGPGPLALENEGTYTHICPIDWSSDGSTR